MGEGRVLAVGASGDPGGVFATLSTAYTVHAEPPETMHWTWLDTADWRLHRAGIALREERRGRIRELVLDVPGAPHETATVSGVTWPARLDALTASPLRSRLAGTVGVRALLPVAEVEAKRIPLRLMDALDKTRVRVSVEQQRLITPRKAALPLHIVVRALRGYDADAQRCVELLDGAMSAADTDLSPTDAALAAAGHLPDAGADAYVATPGDPAVWPVARALLEHVRAVDESRDGALADLDTEFLHELRVAIRETRALLRAVGELLPGRAAVRVERDLSWLEEVTGRLRDVDITLLQLAGDGTLDVTDTDDLEPLRKELHRHRRAELRRMRTALRGDRAPAAFTQWRDELRRMTVSDTIGPTAAEAGPDLAVAAHDALVAAGPDDRLDRVDGLREVLRAFAATLPATGSASRSASTLTDDLDELHRAIRTRDWMLIAAERLTAAAAGADMPRATVLTAGALRDRARRAARTGEADIAARLAKLTGPKTRARVEGLRA